MRLRCTLAAGALVLFASSSAVAQEIPSPLDREAVVSLALSRNPTIRATQQRASAVERRADAEGKLPSPELEVQVWQLPFTSTQGMLMAGVRQSFPAMGLALGARADAMRAEARGVKLETSNVERDLRKRAAHAFVDYYEATERMHLHGTHVELAQRILAAARAKTEAGGSLSDVTQADVELATMTVEHEESRIKRQGARAEINALLVRAADAALPDPIASAPVAPAWAVERIVEEAQSRRPEVAMARAAAEVEDAKRAAAKREWLAPTITVGALYFAPVGPTNISGFGGSITVELPWLWGERKARFDAASLDAKASQTRVEGSRVDVAGEVALAWRDAIAAALRVKSYDDLVLPATRKALDVAFASYTSAKSDLAMLLLATRSLVDAELARLAAATTLEHALVDLDAAAGFPVPREPLAQWRTP